VPVSDGPTFQPVNHRTNGVMHGWTVSFDRSKVAAIQRRTDYDLDT